MRRISPAASPETGPIKAVFPRISPTDSRDPKLPSLDRDRRENVPYNALLERDTSSTRRSGSSPSSSTGFDSAERHTGSMPDFGATANGFLGSGGGSSSSIASTGLMRRTGYSFSPTSGIPSGGGIFSSRGQYSSGVHPVYSHMQQPVRVWHVLFVLGLAVQLYIFHKFEVTMRCLHSQGWPMTPGQAQKFVVATQDRQMTPLSEQKGVLQQSTGAMRSDVSNRGIPETKNASMRNPKGAFESENGVFFRTISPHTQPLPVFNSCQLAQVGGRASDNYGAWVLCSNHMRPRSIVYSFGLGLDISFDNALTLEGHRVFGFDPTVTAEHVRDMFIHNHGRDRQPVKFQFRQLGLSPDDGVVAFHHANNPKVQSQTAVSLDSVKANYRHDRELQAPVLRLATFMCSMHHPTLDVLKMDVEGVEFGVCLSESFRTMLPRIGQVLIEFHERMIKGGADDKAACFKVLQGEGFTVVHISVNKQEISFARVIPNGAILPVRPLQ